MNAGNFRAYLKHIYDELGLPLKLEIDLTKGLWSGLVPV